MNLRICFKYFSKPGSVFFCPVCCRYKRVMIIEAEELAKYPLILRETGSGTREAIDRIAGERGFQIEPLWETASTEALISAVSGGPA